MPTIFNRRRLNPVRHFINKYLGWRNWSVLVYNSVIENMFVIFYIALVDRRYSWTFIADFFIFIFFSIFCTSYGYLINDYGDRELDALHGKENTFQDDSRARSRLVVAFFFVLSVAAGFRFFRQPFFLPLWSMWIFSASAYSLRPFRLKERGATGLVIVVGAQRVLPALLMFSAFGLHRVIDITVLTVYILLRGLSSDLNHQLEDREQDAHTGTGTYAVRSGARRVRTIFGISLEAEKIFLGISIFIMLAATSSYRIAGVMALLPLGIIYAAAYLLSLTVPLPAECGYRVNPFERGRKDVFQFLHHALPSVVMPLYLLVILLVYQPLFTLPLLGCVVLHRLYSPAMVRNSFPFRLLQQIALLSRRIR